MADTVNPEDLIKFGKTSRGFAVTQFRDLYDIPCSLQEGSLATVDTIWFGCDKARMHLNREQVKRLLPVLQRFVETGELQPDRDEV
jgi:hypothetical protein